MLREIEQRSVYYSEVIKKVFVVWPPHRKGWHGTQRLNKLDKQKLYNQVFTFSVKHSIRSSYLQIFFVDNEQLRSSRTPSNIAFSPKSTNLHNTGVRFFFFYSAIRLISESRFGNHIKTQRRTSFGKQRLQIGTTRTETKKKLPGIFEKTRESRKEI